jgi:hypothetical protein
MLIWIEIGVALWITALVFGSTLFFKPEHMEHNPLRVRVGAVLQGLILGGLVGFFILPLRLAFFLPDPQIIADAPRVSHTGLASLSLIPIFVFLVVVRRGLLARLPFLGRSIRAYRRAALLYQIDGAKKSLVRLEALDGKVSEL